MIDFINKFKIPTLLGLGIIFFGLISGLFLVLEDQVFLSQAAPDTTPQNIILTNIAEDSIVISWQTDSPAASFINFGQNNPSEQAALDDRDTDSASAGPKPHLNHYVTLKNLLPKTTYQYKIISGKISSDVQKFQTAGPLASKVGFTPIIGSILDNNTPLNDGIVYLSIPGATTQSALIKKGGNFLIPLSQIRKSDLSDYSPAEGETIKLAIRSDKGEANILFNLTANSVPLPPIKLGQNIDLTTQDINKYDLDNDGKVTSIDYAILSSCLGKQQTDILTGGKSCNKADLNGDQVIDRKDQDLMTQRP